MLLLFHQSTLPLQLFQDYIIYLDSAVASKEQWPTLAWSSSIYRSDLYPSTPSLFARLDLTHGCLDPQRPNGDTLYGNTALGKQSDPHSSRTFTVPKQAIEPRRAQKSPSAPGYKARSLRHGPSSNCRAARTKQQCKILLNALRDSMLPSTWLTAVTRWRYPTQWRFHKRDREITRDSLMVPLAPPTTHLRHMRETAWVFR
jgi:hypothetical protein